MVVVGWWWMDVGKEEGRSELSGRPFVSTYHPPPTTPPPTNRPPPTGAAYGFLIAFTLPAESTVNFGPNALSRSGPAAFLAPVESAFGFEGSAADVAGFSVSVGFGDACSFG